MPQGKPSNITAADEHKAVHNKEADSFYTALLQFLQQADTVDLKTKAYPKHFAGLQVKVSFGSGNKAQVPWIAFLKKEDRVQDGIYPVYLYYATH